MRKTLLRLLRMAKPWRKNQILTVFSLLMAALLNLVTPDIVRRLTALLEQPENLTGKIILLFSLLLLLSYLLRAFFRFLALWQAHIGAWNFVGDMMSRTYEKLQKLSLKFYNDKQTGEIMSRAINDNRNLEQLFAHALPDLASNVLIVVGVSVMIFLINPALAALTLIPVPFVLWASTLFSKKIAPLFRHNQEVLGEVNAEMQDHISGIKEIQAFAKEEPTFAKMKEECRRYASVNIKANFANALFTPSIELLTSMGTIIVMGIGGVLAMHRQMDGSDIVGFFMYLSLFYQPLQTFSRIAEDIQTGLAGANRVLSILDAQSDVKQAPDAVDAPKGKGDIAFQSVCFSYRAGEPVLDHISFHAKPGQMIAFVGATGAGKTTLVSLLERFYDPDEGEVLLDGQNIKNLTLHSLRENLSIVLQDVFLFNGSIYENIAYGKDGATEQEVYAAAKAARADDFIRAMPEGYRTRIGERGARLSGGQKQRIAIARAILRDTPVLILDEATSAVDNETEEQIREAIRSAAKNRTVLVIAHRLSTVRDADRILVLNNGRIVEDGTHRQLLEKNGIYASLCRVHPDSIE